MPNLVYPQRSRIAWIMILWLKESMTPNCGTCHADHKGVDHDLKRVADVHCTTCHNAKPGLASGVS